MVPTTQRKGLSQSPGWRGASPRRGRVAMPDVSGGKARQIYALVARGPGARAGVRGATLGREPPPCSIGIRPEFRVCTVLEKQGRVSGRWFQMLASCKVTVPKWAFPPTWRVLECRERVWKRASSALGHLRNIGVFDCDTVH